MSSLTNEWLLLFLYTARAVHEPVRANGAGLGAKRGEARAVHEPARANGAGLGAKRGEAQAVHGPVRANGAENILFEI